MPAQIGEAQIAVLAKHQAVRSHLPAIGLDKQGVEQLSFWTQDVYAARKHVGGKATAVFVKCQPNCHAGIVVIELALLSLGCDLYHRRITRSSVAAVEVALPVKNRAFQAWHWAAGSHLISDLCSSARQICELRRQAPFRNINHLLIRPFSNPMLRLRKTRLLANAGPRPSSRPCYKRHRSDRCRYGPFAEAAGRWDGICVSHPADEPSPPGMEFGRRR